MVSKCLILLGLTIVTVSLLQPGRSSEQGPYEPTWESLDKRPLPAWYDEGKIGIFIHWGVFSVPGMGEWFWQNWKGIKSPKAVQYMKDNYKPSFTYQDFAKEFTAELYNATRWASLFAASGAKYVVLTSKHHEGYTLWPSKFSFSWNSMDVGPQRDLVGELATAIRNNTDLKFGLYHSRFEWFNPLYLDDKASNFTKSRFVQFKTGSELYELVEMFHPEVIWSDGEWEASATYWRSKEFLAWLYNESPVKNTVVVNDRWGSETLCKHGGYLTCKDRYIPGQLMSRKWENCLSIDKLSWGFRKNAYIEDYYTPQDLIETLVETVALGGNLLMNVGPTEKGVIPVIFEERLQQVGQWLSVNGDAIYGTSPWPVCQNDTSFRDIWYTSKRYGSEEETLYAIFFQWPKAGVARMKCVPPLQSTAKIHLLGISKSLKNAFLGFHRLSIVYTPFGIQPLRIYQHPNTLLLCNGELYNFKELGNEFGFNYETGSDVECIIQLYHKFGIEKCAQQLDGVYAFCLVDLESQCFFVGRDPYGVRPVFRLVTNDGIVGIASEAKGLMDLAKNFNGAKWHIEQFPPATVAKYQLGKNGQAKLVEEKKFYEIGRQPYFKPWVSYDVIKDDISANIRELLTAAVEKRLMANRRIGCLLSGGLDSSLISALLVKLCKEKKLPYKIQSFSVGLGEDSPDLVAAREVAKFIGSEHYEVRFTESDVLDVLDDVIYTLETCDITTIRASICMYLIARYIKQHTDTTVIFSGEGADEVAQGYIYFRNAPSPEEGSADSRRLLSEIYLYDGLRADRTTSAHSLELRVPFLDQQFTNYFLNLPVELRQPRDGSVEKYLIRAAFDGLDLLPDNILWRHKEAFSDGVAHAKRSLFNMVQDWVEDKVSDEELADAPIKYPHLTPQTKESYYYRTVFEKHYPDQAPKLVPNYWMPRWTDVKDPSARFISHYAAS